MLKHTVYNKLEENKFSWKDTTWIQKEKQQKNVLKIEITKQPY